MAPIRVRHPLRSAAALFHSKWFALGWLIAILAWVLHAGALALAPLSIVQAVLSGGLVFLAVLAERFFGFHLGRWQWFGVMITAAGLAVIGLTGGGATRPQHSSLPALIAVESAIFGVGAALLAISAHRRVMHRVEGLLLGLAARTGTKRLHHPIVGDLELSYESMDLAADSCLTLNVYTAEAGSPSQQALDLLASWTATLVDEQATRASGEARRA